MRFLTTDPKERDPSLYWDAVHQSSFYFIDQSLNLPRQYRKLTGRMVEALNVDAFGGVPNSSWFTNRLGVMRMSRQELQRGPDRIAGPLPDAPWTITRAKTEGVTPGFFIRDANGESFVLKFDPAAHPELATGAEMVSTKLFHAFGYNVPENYLVEFDPAILKIKEGLHYKDARGRSREFTRELLDEVFKNVAVRPSGRIRAIASRLLPGKPVGPFSYKGIRKDDPNDVVPHEHRRELRGMKLFAQLLNHFDTKDHNSLDVIVEEDGRRFVRHFLIDFGSTLGSDGDEPKPVYKGYSYVFDLEQAVVSLATLGLRRWSWERADTADIPSAVGYFESDLFDPPGWKPLHGNPAFDNMTYADAIWACRILAALSKDDVRACVETARFSDSAANHYLVRTIMHRREKILAYYLSKVTPLTNFTTEDNGRRLDIRFSDLKSTAGLIGGSSRQFEAELRCGGSEICTFDGFNNTALTIPEKVRDIMKNNLSRIKPGSGQVFTLRIRPAEPTTDAPWVQVYIFFDGDAERTRTVGTWHEY